MAQNGHVFALRQNPACILCPETAPPCACDPGEVCVSVSRTCDSCGFTQCLPQSAPSTPSSSPGVSPGVVAAAVVASVLAFAVALALYLWYRRRWQRQTYPTRVADEKQEVPARAEDVLNRPDPNARMTLRSSPDMPTFRADSDGSSSVDAADMNSSSYAATHGHSHVPRSSQYPAFSGVNSDHRLSAGTHPNLISATFNPGAPSLVGMDAVQDTPNERPPLLPQVTPTLDIPSPQLGDHSRLDIRNSYNTTTTFSSDLSSIPIVEASHGTVKHVVGFTRAEVIRTPKPSLSSVRPSLHFNSLSGTKSTIGVASEKPPPVPTSPLATTRFLISQEPPLPEDLEDPFQDRRTPSPIPHKESRNDIMRRSGAPSMATFGDSGEQRWPPLRAPRLPWMRKLEDSRTNSGATEPGSVPTPSTGSTFGLRWSKRTATVPQTPAPPHSTDVPHTPASFPAESPRSADFPSSSRRDMLTVPGVFEQQQRDAIVPSPSRISVVSAASGIAESILSAFPFVPPSPVPSVGSLQTPPRSLLVQQASSGSNAERRGSNATSASAVNSTLVVDSSRPRTAPATPSSHSSSTLPPSSSGTRRSSLTGDSTKQQPLPSPLFLNRKVDRSRLSIDRDASR